MQQTAVTDYNKEDYYKFVYPTSIMVKDSLLNLDEYPGTKILLDCAGWNYQLHFPAHNILKIENAHVCKEYQLVKNYFDKLYVNEKFPDIAIEGTLILDHSPLLKYKTNIELNRLLTNITDSIQTDTVVLRMSMITMGDYRFTDRFKNLINFIPDKFIIEHLTYNLKTLTAKLNRKKKYDFN